MRQQHEEPLDLEGVEHIEGFVDALPGAEEGVVSEGEEEEEEDFEGAAALTVSVKGIGESAGLNDVAVFFKKSGKVANAYRVSKVEVRVQICDKDGMSAAIELSGSELCGGIISVEKAEC